MNDLREAVVKEGFHLDYDDYDPGKQHGYTQLLRDLTDLVTNKQRLSNCKLIELGKMSISNVDYLLYKLYFSSADIFS